MARSQNVIWTFIGILALVAMFFYAISEQRWSEKPGKAHLGWAPTPEQKKLDRLRHEHHHPAPHH